ncbi:CHASE domain-containing protein [Halopseudomonas aestusnigri]|uniref:CHASE domain-containing protein n=1 Tax=Halopseudomonas aestusnigri TaxID=857252 RepID=UPI002554907F|nr:CHASE domain-containing protein [Halopseudomonas aestusnigri]MDL2199265.1 CHASE domain-containing protein [Halopseudomonas aestusnigri]
MTIFEHAVAKGPRWMPFVVLLCGLLTTLGAWYALYAIQEKVAAEEFQQLGDEVLEAIERRMSNHRQILLGAAGLFDASTDVSRDDWRRYVQHLDLDSNYPGILGLGYSQVVQPNQLHTFEQSVRQQGFAEFAIKPAGKRDLYTSITYLEPFSGRNLAAFGYDMFSEPTRRDAMTRAAETGLAQLTSKVTLLQENNGPVQAGLLMYVPVYQTGAQLNSSAERWGALLGFVYSPYRVTDLMNALLDSRDLQIDFALYAGALASPEQRIFISHPRLEMAGDPSRTNLLELFGQPVYVTFYAQPGFYERFQQGQGLLLILGGVISLLLFLLTLLLANGQQRAIALASDMTSQLRHSEERLRRVLQGGHDGWWDQDVEAGCFFASAQIWRMLGYPDHGPQTPFKDLLQLVYADDVPALREQFVAPAGVMEHYLNHECRLIRQDGQPLCVRLRALIQCSPEGRMLSASGTAMDLTEQKRIEQLKNDFVSTVSHELRTPLTSISGSLGLVNGGAFGTVPDSMRPMLEIAQQNSQRLSHLINDLLDMDKLAAGKLNFELTNLDLGQLLSEALLSNASYAEQHQVQLVLDTMPTIKVRADALRLHQVLANYLSNAIKFSPSGASVRVHSTLKDGRVRVSVTDSGRGIPEHFHSHIFQKFSQADSSDQRQKGGSGLGLAITKELIERMGGLVGFDSLEGQGSMFWFELPVLVENPPLLDTQRPTIMVVEDEPDVAKLLQLMLESGGYQVVLAGNLAAARHILETHEVAAVTLDLRLPDGHGFEVLLDIQRTERTRDLPVMVISAEAEHGRLNLQGGVHLVDWLEKPIDPHRVLSGLRRALGNMQGKPRILHIEDDPDLRMVVAGQARNLAEFIGAGNLVEARQQLARGSWDLVLLDLLLPDGNGFTLIEEIHQYHPGLPIVVLSSTELSTEQLSSVEAALAKSRTEPRAFLDVLARLLPTKGDTHA